MSTLEVAETLPSGLSDEHHPCQAEILSVFRKHGASLSEDAAAIAEGRLAAFETAAATAKAQVLERLGGVLEELRQRTAATGERAAVQAEIAGLVQDRLERAGAEACAVAANHLAAAEIASRAGIDEVLQRIASSTRRIREARDVSAALAELGSSAAQFCQRVAILLNDKRRVTAYLSCGVGDHPPLGELWKIAIPLADAPALERAAQQRVTMRAKARAEDVSSLAIAGLGIEAGCDVVAFPIVLRETVLGLLLAQGEPIRSSAIESLVLTTEAWIEALDSRS